MRNRSWFAETLLSIPFFLTVLLSVLQPTQAQQAKQVPHVGLLVGSSGSAVSTRIDAFRQGLRELGYVEKKNIAIEYRYADGKIDRLPELAADLLAAKVKIIVTTGPASTRSAKQSAPALPIVMAMDDDPLGAGFVASLSRPGGNITGLSTLSPEISGKQLELLREIVTKLARVGVLGDAIRPGIPQALREIQAAADAFQMQAQYLEIRTASDIERAFQSAGKEHLDAALVLGSPLLNSERKRVADLAVKSRLPAIYRNLEFMENGGLMAYGVSYTDLFRRAAVYVDKILKGAKPADLPVEQPTKFEFVINLKTAKQIGLTIPPNVLARANKVIR